MLTQKLLDTAFCHMAQGGAPRSAEEADAFAYLLAQMSERKAALKAEAQARECQVAAHQECVRLYKARKPLPAVIPQGFALSFEPRKGFNEEAKFKAARKR